MPVLLSAADAAALAALSAEIEDRLENDPLFAPTRWRNHWSQPMEATGLSQPMEATGSSLWSKPTGQPPMAESFADRKQRLKHILDDVPGGPAERDAAANRLSGWETWESWVERPAKVGKLNQLNECVLHHPLRPLGGA